MSLDLLKKQFEEIDRKTRKYVMSGATKEGLLVFSGIQLNGYVKVCDDIPFGYMLVVEPQQKGETSRQAQYVTLKEYFDKGVE